jgi:hypothetical protein
MSEQPPWKLNEEPGVQKPIPNAVQTDEMTSA